MMLLTLISILVFPLEAQRTPLPEGEWYRSNSLGALIDRIEWFRKGDWEWVAQRIVKTSGDQINLYQNGKMFELRIRDFDAEGRIRKVRIIRSNQTRDAFELDEKGNIVLEEFWLENRLRGRIEYIYQQQVLVQRKLYGANARLVYTDEIMRTPEGRIRRVIRRYGNQLEWHSWNWGSDGLGSEIGKEGEQSFFSAYGAANQVRRRELILQNSLFQISEFEWKNDRLLRRRDRILPTNSDERRLFDEKGNTILLEIRQNERLIAQERFWYENDRVVQKQRISKDSIQTNLYTYDNQGKLVKEEVINNNNLEAVFYYEEEKLVKEEFYLMGRLVVQTTWENGVKVLETFFDVNGQTRTRDPRILP